MRARRIFAVKGSSNTLYAAAIGALGVDGLKDMLASPDPTKAFMLLYLEVGRGVINLPTAQGGHRLRFDDKNQSQEHFHLAMADRDDATGVLVTNLLPLIIS